MIRMKGLIAGIGTAFLVFIGIQTIAPFPYGLIFGVGTSAFIVWYTLKQTSINKYSLLNYRRVDPKTEKERLQNEETFRIIKKEFLEGKISEEEFENHKKEFGKKD